MLDNNTKFYESASYNDVFVGTMNDVKAVKTLADDATAIDFSDGWNNAITVSDAKSLSVVFVPDANKLVISRLIVTNSAETESTVTLAGGTGCVLNGTAAQAVAAGATKVITLYYFDGKVIVG